MAYRVDLHILDHAAFVNNHIEEYNPNIHKNHFKCSIDTSQLIVGGFNSKEKINDIMKKLLHDIVNTEYDFKVKTRSYVNKKGETKEYYSTKRFNLKEDTLSAYHNRSYNSELDFDNIEPHFHFLFSNKNVGLSYYHLKKHLQACAAKYDLVFHFAEDKEYGANKHKGLMKRCSNFSWWTQKMSDTVFTNYVHNKGDDLAQNLESLFEYTQKNNNIQFYIKVMNNLKQRLLDNQMSFEWRGHDIAQLYPIPLNENMSKTLEAIVKEDITALSEYKNRDNFILRDYIKYCNGFQSTIIDELKLRGYQIKKLDFEYDNMQAKPKSKKEKVFDSFNGAVKKDLEYVLSFASNEKELKNLMQDRGYSKVGFKNKNIDGKRQKIGIKFEYNQKAYTVYFNQLNTSWSSITQRLMQADKEDLLKFESESALSSIKFFNSYQNTIFKEIYHVDIDVDLSKYFISEKDGVITVDSNSSKIIDQEDKILSSKISDEEIKLIVQMMHKKGWTDLSKINFNDSSDDFKSRVLEELLSH